MNTIIAVVLALSLSGCVSRWEKEGKTQITMCALGVTWQDDSSVSTSAEHKTP